MPLAIGGIVAAGCVAAFRDPLGVAFAAVLACTLLVPMLADDVDAIPARTRPRRLDYLMVVLPVAFAVAWTSNTHAALVVAAIAGALLGMVELLAAFRLPTRYACGLVVATLLIFVTWPVWLASTMNRIDTDGWLQRLIDVSPTFALNRAIAPDATFTHRGWMYEWTNLGQDIPYALPKTVWPCVGLFGMTGFVGVVAGMVSRRFTQMNADEVEPDGSDEPSG